MDNFNVNDLNEISSINNDARNILSESGWVVAHSRFPYTYHHDNFRFNYDSDQQIQISRANVGEVLMDWGLQMGAKAYAWECIAGAVEELQKSNSTQLIPIQIVLGIRSHKEIFADSFKQYACNELKNLENPEASQFAR